MYDQYPRLRYELANREGFARSIVVGSGWDTLVWVGLGGAALAWFANLMGTIRGMINDGVPFRYFPDVFFYEEGVWTVLIWAPAVLLPLAAIGFAAKMLTKQSSMDKLFERYVSTGFIANTFATGIRLDVGKEQHTVALCAHPSVPFETVSNLATYVQSLMSDPRSPAYKECNKQLMQVPLVGNSKAMPVQTINPTYPAGVWFVRANVNVRALGIMNAVTMPTGSRPVVLIPDGVNTATVHVLKDDVAIS